MSDKTTEENTALYTVVIEDALALAASRRPGAPDLTAAIAALVDVQAALIAKVPDRNDRRRIEKEANDLLHRRIVLRMLGEAPRAEIGRG